MQGVIFILVAPRCEVEGQTYIKCGTACPPTCSKPEPVKCTRQCVPGCQCPRGTVLDEDNKRCVRPQFCPRPDQSCGKLVTLTMKLWAI